MSTDYVPISCHFYDELESAAVKHRLNTIVYTENNEKKTVQAKVIDFKTKNKEEFMILDTQLIIRLDKIITFNDIKVEFSQSCQNF